MKKHWVVLFLPPSLPCASPPSHPIRSPVRWAQTGFSSPFPFLSFPPSQQANGRTTGCLLLLVWAGRPIFTRHRSGKGEKQWGRKGTSVGFPKYKKGEKTTPFIAAFKVRFLKGPPTIRDFLQRTIVNWALIVLYCSPRQ